MRRDRVEISSEERDRFSSSEGKAELEATCESLRRQLGAETEGKAELEATCESLRRQLGAERGRAKQAAADAADARRELSRLRREKAAVLDKLEMQVCRLRPV